MTAPKTVVLPLHHGPAFCYCECKFRTLFSLHKLFKQVSLYFFSKKANLINYQGIRFKKNNSFLAKKYSGVNFYTDSKKVVGLWQRVANLGKDHKLHKLAQI